MDIELSRKQAEQIGFERLEAFGLEKKSWGWRGNTRVPIDLDEFNEDKLSAFVSMLVAANDEHGMIYGLKQILRDIDVWRDARESAKDSDTPVKTLVAFEPMLTEFIRRIPGHRIYQRGSDHDGYDAFFVHYIRYHPPVKHKKTKDEPAWTEPAYVEMHVEWDHSIYGKMGAKFSWVEGEVKNKTIPKILAEAGMFPETKKLRRLYNKMTKRFHKWFSSIGMQLLANGSAELKTKGDSWWSVMTRNFKLVNARVVVDVLKEGETGEDESEEPGDTHHPSNFWKVSAINEETGLEELVPEQYERPIHHYLKVFHLGKHMNLVLHISSLTRYKYDTNLIDKLVIDKERKQLVSLLVQHGSSKYTDIIGEKGGGAIVLLCGKPGTGKTLTAEVFAESEKRALYTVQCAQLGTTAEELETELLKVMARAQRWNAVLLLDECDVYVRKRGKDVNQNAIVGVFLRVLEYQNAVMFLTTNRAQDIDDAVASRCIAKLVYEAPDFDEQCEIWRVLSEAASADIGGDEIKVIAQAHPDLVGRDVKNLIKLAMLVRGEQAITASTIEFVRQFKPT